MIKVIKLSVTIIMLLVLVMTTACSGAKFELESLEITPDKVGTGDTATVTVDVTNTGTVEGTYAATLTIDSVPVDTDNVTLPVGATKKVTFAVVKETVGVYKVRVGKLTGTLQVVKPAEFRLSSLEVTPLELILGDRATAIVGVSNIGDLSGNYTCTLLIDGVTAQSEEVTVDSGATKTVALTFTPKERGVHQLATGNLTQTILVMKPAEFSLSSLVVSPDEAVSGSSVTVTASVTNVGDIKGDHTVMLLFNGKTESQKVTLAGGEKKTVSFTVAAEAIGVHTIKVNNLSGKLVVVPTAPVGYKGYIDRENGFFVAYPSGWEQEKMASALIDFVGPVEGGFKPVFIVAKQTSSQLTTPRELIRQILLLMQELYQGFRAISTEDLTINGIPAARSTYTFSFAGIGMKGQQVVLIKDKDIFIITYQALQATYDSRYASTFNTITNSFIFLPTYP